MDRLRQALLTAVGHDLRTPLTGIKAAVSTLRQPDLTLRADARAELLATIEESTDRLDAVVDNLLSIGRLRAGAVTADLRPVPLDAVVAQALLHTSTARAIRVDVPDDLPHVHADPGLLERVVANLVANAEAASPPERPIVVHGHAEGDRIQLDIIDHGRAYRPRRWTGCSSRSSASTTAPPRQGWASAWPSPAASPTSCTAPSSRPTPVAAASP